MGRRLIKQNNRPTVGWLYCGRGANLEPGRAHGASPRTDAVADRPAGHRRRHFPRRFGGGDGAGPRHAPPGISGRRHRALPRPPGGRDRPGRRRADLHGVRGGVRPHPRGAGRRRQPGRPSGPERVVWIRSEMAPIIEVDNLTKSYGGKRGVIDVSFEVPEGEVFGFLGPNGAGKTTTIRTLMALLKADAGTARIAGLDAWQESVAIKKLVGYAPGEPALDPNLTGGQILEYFAHLRGGVDHAYLKRLVERFELDTGRKFRQYSTGNKRKVDLIQAFMHRPRLLILDEPTSGLDPLNQQEFDGLVREARDEGRTVFLSSHVLSEVEKTCTRVGIIREGRLVRLRRVHELKDSTRYEITISFAQPVPADAFSKLEGVVDVELSKDGHAV